MTGIWHTGRLVRVGQGGPSEGACRKGARTAAAPRKHWARPSGTKWTKQFSNLVIQSCRNDAPVVPATAQRRKLRRIAEVEKARSARSAWTTQPTPANARAFRGKHRLKWYQAPGRPWTKNIALGPLKPVLTA